MAKEKLTLTVPIPSLPKLPSRSKLLGVAASIFLVSGSLIASGPLAPITLPVTVSINDEYGGVFKTLSTCEPRSAKYQWTAGDVTVQPQSIPTERLTSTVSSPTVSRSSTVTCTWNFFVSINPPDVGPVERVLGKGAFPADLGVWDVFIGSEKVGSFAPQKNSSTPATVTKTVLVTNTLYGIARLGDLAAKCSGDSGNFPEKWSCTGRQVWDGTGWIGWYSYDKYRNIEKFHVTAPKNPDKNKCWGVNSYKDFKAGATVTVTGDHGAYTTKLVNPGQIVLSRTIPMQNNKWYLVSKSSKITVCQFNWAIENLPFSPTGYLIKVGKRDAVKIDLVEIDNNGWLIFTDYGNTIPEFTKD